MSGSYKKVKASDLLEIYWLLADAEIGFKPGVPTFHLIANGNDVEQWQGPIVGNIEVAADPDGGAADVWRLRINRSDANSQSVGSRRAEFAFTDDRYSIYPGQPVNIDFSFRINDYSGSTDNFLFFQLYSAPDANAWSPVLGFYMLSGVFTIQTRSGLVFDSTETDDVYVNPGLSALSWHDVSIQAKLSSSNGWRIAEDGALRIIIDSVVVFESTAFKFGYNYFSKIKAGLYQWNESTNWDASYLTKEIYMKGPYISR